MKIPQFKQNKICMVYIYLQRERVEEKEDIVKRIHNKNKRMREKALKDDGSRFAGEPSDGPAVLPVGKGRGDGQK